MTQYGFQLYRIAGLCTGAKVVLADDSPNLTASVDNILAAVTPRTRIVFLANPNNPTGTLISAAEVRRLVAGLPGSVLLVLDAAYMHYVDDPAYSSGTELIGEGRKNVVVLGTFSKAFGLAGLRLGWAYCPPEIVGVLDRIRPTFGVPVPALRAGLVALEDTAHVAREVAHVRAQRPVLEAGLRRLGLRVIPGTANFTLARMPRADQPADALVAHLRTAGILVRPVKNYALADSLRITIGTQAEIAAVLAAVAAFPGLHGDIARRVGT
jgi:histidinol-phosphate aminotransferase